MGVDDAFRLSRYNGITGQARENPVGSSRLTEPRLEQGQQMGSGPNLPPLELQAIGIEPLKRAVEIFLKHAYPSGKWPEIVQRRLEWPASESAQALVSHPPFECCESGRKPSARPIYCLRLGNHRYPNMKLQIQTWDSDCGYLLSVNTHDQAQSLELEGPGAAEFRQIQSENERIKNLIEAEWDQVGLPTFNRFLSDYIRQPQPQAQPPA